MLYYTLVVDIWENQLWAQIQTGILDTNIFVQLKHLLSNAFSLHTYSKTKYHLPYLCHSINSEYKNLI